MKTLTIERIGHRGEGVSHDNGVRVFVPYALTGEIVTATIRGNYAEIIDILTPAPHRVAPVCDYYSQCGGCAVQTLQHDAYLGWKRGLVEKAGINAGVVFNVTPVIDAHNIGRRRVTFHARMNSGRARVGFMAARSHQLVEIDACPLLSPDLSGAMIAARDIAQILASRGKPLDIAITTTPEGLDIDLRGAGPLDKHETAALMKTARMHQLARLTNHGQLLTLNQTPTVTIDTLRAPLPSGAFLQATHAGEEEIARLVILSLSRAKSVADLFCGIGAFALRLARRSSVAAYDNSAPSIEALQATVRDAAFLKPVSAQTRDLFTRPLTAQELEAFDGVVFDPPRAGALAQAKELAQSTVKTIVAVSCNAQSFSRDAAILIAGGYSVGAVTPIDQFRYSPHVEIVATFSHRDSHKRAKRRLLG